MQIIFKNYNVDKKIIKQYNNLYNDLTELKRILHKLDESSFSFRHPVKNDGKLLILTIKNLKKGWT
jgi:hypothetical protein